MRSSGSYKHFSAKPSTSVPEGARGIEHISEELSRFGLGFSRDAIAVIRRGIDLGMVASMIVDGVTPDGRPFRLRYNVPEQPGSGSYRDADGIDVHVDSEAYDFEFAMGLGRPVDARVYLYDPSCRISLKSSGGETSRLAFSGSKPGSRPCRYRIFRDAAEMAHYARWRKAVELGKADLFDPRYGRKGSGQSPKDIAKAGTILAGAALVGSLAGAWYSGRIFR